MSIQIHTASTTRKGNTSTIEYRVETTPGVLTQADQDSSWMQEIGRESIIGVKTVAIQSAFIYSAPRTEAEWAEHRRYNLTTYTVIETAHGSAAVLTFSRGNSEIVGITAKGGRKDKALTVGTWRKYGSKRGHGLAWQRAMAAAKVCTSPNAGKDICRHEAHTRLRAGAYPAQAA